MDVKNSAPHISDELNRSLESLVSKIDVAVSTYGITRDELFVLLSDVLDSDRSC